jgi:hypothetical protein
MGHAPVEAQEVWQELWPFELELSDTQVMRLDSLRDRMADVTFQIEQEVSQESVHRSSQPMSVAGTTTSVKPERESMMRLEQKLKKAHYDYQASIRNVLTRDQWRRYRYYQMDLDTAGASTKVKLIAYPRQEGRLASTRHLRARISKHTQHSRWP